MNLLEISNTMVNASPVFIIGGARSGSSILYKTMQKHSAFKPKKIDLTETRIFTLSNQAYFLEHHAARGNIFRYMMENQDAIEQFLRSTILIRRWQRITHFNQSVDRMIRRYPAFNQYWWRINLNHYFFRSFFFFAKEARGCRRIVEKTPSHVNHYREILDAFPNARLLYIYRHPVDIYSSYRRRLKVEVELGKDPKDLGWLTMSVDDFCNRYKGEIDIVLKLANDDGNKMFLVQYEKFTQDPRGEFRQICDFLGEDFESAALVEEAPDLTKWAPDPNLFGQIVASTKSWEEYLDQDEAQQIEENLEGTIQALGYERYTYP